LAIVKRAFTLAGQAHKVHARPHIEMLAEAPPRAGFFEHSDFETVCKKLPTEIAPLARFCYITGWRWKSEVRPLTWSQVNFARNTVTIDPGKTKGGEPRVFVMTPDLKRLLKKQRTYTDAVEAETGKPCPLVFHRRGNLIEWFYDSWRAACEAAKVPGRLIHDLRRTAIRNLVRAGVSESVAMKMSGHKTRAIFDRYNVTSEKDLRAAAALLGAHHKVLARGASTTKLLQSKRRAHARQIRSA
jgi:integrase